MFYCPERFASGEARRKPRRLWWLPGGRFRRPLVASRLKTIRLLHKRLRQRGERVAIKEVASKEPTMGSREYGHGQPPAAIGDRYDDLARGVRAAVLPTKLPLAQSTSKDPSINGYERSANRKDPPKAIRIVSRFGKLGRV